jgi:pilus assembly protein Flp/PilA
MESPTPATLVTRTKTMTDLKRRLKSLLTDDSGQDLIEYALIAALIALAAIAAMRSLSTKISTEFNTIGSSL